MGTITSSVGLISGIDTGKLIDQLLAIEARPKQLVQRNNTVLTSQSTALQEINAKLLALNSSVSNLTGASLYKATTAGSSNNDVLKVTSSNSATPGTYNFNVSRLVSTQQTVTKGFANQSGTGIGSGTLTFEFGDARLDSNTELSRLNGGAGVSRGKIRVLDRAGNSAIIDLSRAVTIKDVLDAINTTTGIDVTASVSGDALKLTDNTGATTAALTVTNIGATNTAASLGLTTDADGSATTITGAQINKLSANSLLTTLNDGNGVRTSAGNDLTLTAGASTFSVDFGNTLLDSNTQLSKFNGGAGVTLGQITVTNRAGAAATVDLTSAVTAGDVITAINAAGINVTASISGNSLVLTDATGATTTALSVANVGATNTATALGLTTDIDATDTTITGTQITISAAATLGDAINAINTAAGNTFITASINSAGTGLKLAYSGPDPLNVTGASSTDLGIAVTGATSDVTGQRLIANLNSRLIKNLRGGTGASLGTVTITPRTGAGAQFNVNLASAASISEVIDLINNNAGNSGKVLASLNNAGNGLLLTDQTASAASNFIVTGTGASDLGIDQNVAKTTINSSNLQFRYVSESTRLDALNGGQGISRGKFIITDSRGISGTIDLSQGNEQTIQDVLDEINSRGLSITASINSNGDGVLIQDTGPGTVKLKVAESGSTTARDLGILGEAATAGDDLDGSFEKTVAIGVADTLSKLVSNINAAGINVQATVVNDGSPANAFRLSLNALKAGAAGAFLFDDGGLDFNASNLVDAKNAVVFFGSADPAKAVAIQSSSNSLASVIPGATIDLKNTSSSPVEVVISRDDSAITTAVQALADNFNSIITTLGKYDTYNADTKERGLLLGDPTVAQVRNVLFRVVNGRNSDLTTQFNALVQLGIKVGDGSKLTFDPAKLTSAIQADRTAVQQLFTFKTSTTDSDGKVTTTAKGIGVALEEAVKNLTDSVTGTLTLRTASITKRIELGTKRIENLDALLASKKLRLQAQFNAMEQTLALLQQQNTALAGFKPLATA